MYVVLARYFLPRHEFSGFGLHDVLWYHIILCPAWFKHAALGNSCIIGINQDRDEDMLHVLLVFAGRNHVKLASLPSPASCLDSSRVAYQCHRFALIPEVPCKTCSWRQRANHCRQSNTHQRILNMNLNVDASYKHSKCSELHGKYVDITGFLVDDG